MEMKYHPDGTPYNAEGSIDLGLDVYRIGWISPEVEFARGQNSCDLEKLAELIARFQFNRFRGARSCPFRGMCRTGTDGSGFHLLKVRSNTILLGMSEIWLKGRNGRILAASSLIHHFISEHHYLVPDEFAEAVHMADIECVWTPSELERLCTVNWTDVVVEIPGKEIAFYPPLPYFDHLKHKGNP